MTIRPPGRVTRTISLATSNGLGANIAPKMLTTRSKLRSASSLRLEASPSWNRQFVRPSACARLFPASTRLLAMSTPRTSAPSLRRRQRGRPVAASEVEHLQSRGDAESGDERLAALSHARRDAREVALLPQCLVRIHFASALPWRRYSCRSKESSREDPPIISEAGAGQAGRPGQFLFPDDFLRGKLGASDTRHRRQRARASAVASSLLLSPTRQGLRTPRRQIRIFL